MLNNNKEKYVGEKILIAFEFTNGLVANETEMKYCRKNLKNRKCTRFSDKIPILCGTDADVALKRTLD